MLTKITSAVAAAIIGAAMIASPASAGGSRSYKKPTVVNVGNGGTATGKNAQARGGNDNYVENARKAGRGATINVGNGGRARGAGANASGGSGNTVIF